MFNFFNASQCTAEPRKKKLNESASGNIVKMPFPHAVLSLISKNIDPNWEFFYFSLSDLEVPTSLQNLLFPIMKLVNNSKQRVNKIGILESLTLLLEPTLC